MKTMLVLVFIILFYKSFCQKDVKLSGTLTKFTSGKVFLTPIVNDAKYYSDYRVLTCSVVNGLFSFERKVYDSLPQAYFLTYTNDTLSLETGMLILEPKDQTIVIDSFDIYVYPKIQGSQFQDELIGEYAKFFQPVVNRSNKFYNEFDRINSKYNNEPHVDSLLEMHWVKDSISKEADSLFNVYADKHKTSYISIWKLIDRIKLLGYKSRYEEAFNGLDKSIKESKIGEVLRKDMEQLKVLSTGALFPEMNIQTIGKEKKPFNISSYKGKLVLIEFWFHNCGPCISQFNSLKEIYKKYKKENFEIIAISIDKSEDLMKLNTEISLRKYSWLNLWDEDEKYATTFLINRYPTNILVNEKGEIVDMNVPPYLVAHYVKEQLSRKIYFSNPYEPK